MNILSEELEEQWRNLLRKAKAAKAVYDAAVADDNGSKRAATEMYAANSAVRQFCEAEKQMRQGGLSTVTKNSNQSWHQQTPGA